MDKTLIGRIDKADFPELEFRNITVKIDTGAYTSSIHCEEIAEEDGELTCLFLYSEYSTSTKKQVKFKEYESTLVRSSNGIVQKRYVVRSYINIFNKTHKISLTLNDRSDMRYPVLLGRKFLSGKFIVDPQLAFLSFNLMQSLPHEH